jgi:Ca-activated chloride channel family protein
MNQNQRDELWDRLTDVALREAVGGKQPGGKTPAGNVMPLGRAEKLHGAGAGKGKRPTSAERATWMRPDASPRRSALRVLVVSTCVLIGLTAIIVLNQAAGDRPWLWPVAHDAHVTDNSRSMLMTESFSYHDLRTQEGDADDFLIQFRNVYSGRRHQSQSAGGQTPGRIDRFTVNGQPPVSRTPDNGRYSEMAPTRLVKERERIRQELRAIKGLIKGEQDIEDMFLYSPDPARPAPRAGVGGQTGPGSVNPPGTALPLPAPLSPEAKPVADPFAKNPTGNTSPDASSNTVLNVEVNEVDEKLAIDGKDIDKKIVAELGKLVSKSTVRLTDGTVAAVVDGEDVRRVFLDVAGEVPGPEVIKEITARIKDGRGFGPGMGGDRYQPIHENRFLTVGNNPLSTFSIDVDTASYSKVRRLIFQHHELPPPDAVRLEEFINYHVYRYAPPKPATAAEVAAGAKNHPFAVHSDVAACPWEPKHKLLRVAIKGREIKNEDRPPSNLVFLVDVSGSMDEPDKLPLVKKGLKTLVQRLRATDRVAIAVYAGQAGLVLPSTSGNEKAKIMDVLDELKPEGSTNGAQGILLAYDIAMANFIKEGTNRVILATDGDFNVGTTDDAALVRLVEDRAKSKVFLTTLGFGIGNHNDSMLEQIADKGNGQCAYIDSELETHKVFVEQLSGTLVTIAKDVKIQVEFNPAKVAAYRLLGYENRMLRTEDFKDDTKDAGEIGAGHTVTALYEIVPVPVEPLEAPPVGGVAEPELTALKYQKPAELTDAAKTDELLTVHLRYKEPEADKSQPLDVPVKDADVAMGKAPGDFQFAAAVASFGMLLRNSQYRGTSSLDNVLELAKGGLKDDEHGYRAEFVDMVNRAKEISEGRKAAPREKE